MIKRVFSAGGIVLKKEHDGLKVLVTQHSGHLGWDFPKGHIEAGETSKDAALREVMEETGVGAEIIKKAGDTKYFYFEDKKKVFKTVIYYLMEFLKQGKASTAFEVSDSKWLEVDKVEQQLSFEGTKKLWREVKPSL